MASSRQLTNQLPTSVDNHSHQPQDSGNSIQQLGSWFFSNFTNPTTARVTMIASDNEPTAPATLETAPPYASRPNRQDSDDEMETVDSIEHHVPHSMNLKTTGLPTAAVPTPGEAATRGCTSTMSKAQLNNFQEPASSDSSDDDEPLITCRKHPSTKKTPSAPAKKKQRAPRRMNTNLKPAPASTEVVNDLTVTTPAAAPVTTTQTATMTTKANTTAPSVTSTISPVPATTVSTRMTKARGELPLKSTSQGKVKPRANQIKKECRIYIYRI
jgi:hypothetical protein